MRPKILLDREDLIKFGLCYARIVQGYVLVCVKGKWELLHRAIMDFPQGQVDHRNRDKLDCRKSNLREATHAQNITNRLCSDLNTSGYKGVHWNKRKQRWTARITHNGRRFFLGNFKTAEEAAIIYNEAAKKYHQEFCGLNILKKEEISHE
jgi:hypothetical protein